MNGVLIPKPQVCEWCREVIGTARRFVPVINIPLEGDNQWRKLRFHPACLDKFKSANPNLMRRKEELELRK